MQQYIDSLQQTFPELAAWLQLLAELPFQFDALSPSVQAHANQVHLWMPEYLADYHAQMTPALRFELVHFLIKYWKQRLKNYMPYQQDGYRLFLYEDLVPTLTVIQNSQAPFPYSGRPQRVKAPEDVLHIFTRRSWRRIFPLSATPPTPQHLLTCLQTHAGEIDYTGAQSLKLKPDQLKQLIINYDLTDEVNALRHRFKKEPLNFEWKPSYQYLLYEERLPPWY